MPYCPKCRDEFQDWVKVCPDCGVSLVDELPEPVAHRGQSHDEPTVLIATAPNEAIAAFWSGILKDYGIYCLIKGDNLAVAGYIPRLDAPHEIHVLRSDAKKAEQIIAPFVES